MGILVDHNKINGNYFHMNTNKSPEEVLAFETKNDISMSYMNSTHETISLTDYLRSIHIMNKYEDNMFTIYDIEMWVPNEIAYDIYDMYSNYNDGLYFNLDIYQSQMDRYEKKVNGSIISMMKTSDYSAKGGFNKSPFNGIPLVLVDFGNDIPNKDANLQYDEDAGRIRNFHMTLTLVSKDALNFTRQSHSMSYMNSLVNTPIQAAVKKNMNNCENIVPYIQSPDNPVYFQNVFTQDASFQDFLNLLEDNYGIYTFGHNFFIEGKYLYLGDRQRSNLRNDYDIYLEVYSETAQNRFTSSKIYLLDENTNDKKVYVPVKESHVQPIDSSSSSKEIYGDRLSVKYQNIVVELKLPSNLKKESDQSTYKRKLYYKNKDGIFFETRLLSEYNDLFLNMSVVLKNVDPDLFHYGKHIYLHFEDSTMKSMFNGKFKVIRKIVDYNLPKAKSHEDVYVNLTVTRVIEELPYNMKELTHNDIYRNVNVDLNSLKSISNDGFVTNDVDYVNKIKEISGLSTYTNIKADKLVLDNYYVSDIHSNKIDNYPDMRLWLKLDQISNAIGKRLPIRTGSTNYIKLMSNLKEYESIIVSSIGTLESDKFKIDIDSGIISLQDSFYKSILTNMKVMPILGLYPKHLDVVDLLQIGNDYYKNMMAISLLQIGLEYISNVKDTFIHRDFGEQYVDFEWSSMFVWWIWIKSGVFDSHTTNFVKNGSLNLPYQWMFNSYHVHKMLIGEPISTMDNLLFDGNVNTRSNVSEISIGDVVIFHDLSEDISRGCSSNICLYNDVVRQEIYLIGGNIDDTVKVNKHKYSEQQVYKTGFRYLSSGNFHETDSTIKTVDISDPNILILG